MKGLGVAAHARDRGAKTAICFGERHISYAELDAQANRVAHMFQRLGVTTGDCVGLALRNRPQFFEAALGAARLGADVVSIGWRLKRDEIAYLVADSHSKVVVAESDAETGDAPNVLRIGDSYDAARDAEHAAPIGKDAPVRFRYYTSGTTGRPKAVERPRTTTEAYLSAVLTYPPMQGLTGPDEVHLVCGPLYHTAPCAFAHYALLLGHTVVVLGKFDAREALAAIQAEGVTWTHMVPINFVRILALSGAGTYDVSSLKKVLHAAAPCPVDTKRRIIDLFPPGVVWEYYGMTEGFATIVSPDEWLAKPGTVGRPMPGVRIEILGDDGERLSPGEPGLVYVSSPRGKFAYGGAPDKTAEAWRGDLFTVGDMGYLDSDGYLFLTDRKHDMIITGGANVYPAEVENVLHAHPAVQDTAVVGIPDAEWGEAVHAIVEATGSLSAEDLIAFCRERMAHYKCPRTVEFTDALPRDENGKIRKRELREHYWAGRATRI